MVMSFFMLLWFLKFKYVLGNYTCRSARYMEIKIPTYRSYLHVLFHHISSHHPIIASSPFIVSLLSHRNHPEPDQRGRAVVGLLAVDADVVAGVEVAATVGDATLIHHLRHVAAHVV